VLVDEAVSLFQQDPLRWLLAGWRPVFPLTLALLVFVRFHRVEWLDQQWGATQQAGSLGLSLLVVCAWLLRSVGQGRVCCAVLEQIHPRALAHLRATAAPLRPIEQGWNLALLALITAGMALLGGMLGGVPGLVAAGFLAPVTGIIVFEGRRLPDALVRRLHLPLGISVRGALALALTQFLVFLTWINLVAGAQLLVLLVRMGTGLDLAVVERLVALSNPGFLFFSLGIAFLLVEPLWAIQRALIYLDTHLSQSGIDLLERWEELAPTVADACAPKLSPQAPGLANPPLARVLSLVLAVLCGVATAGPLQAADAANEVEAAQAVEYVTAGDFALRLEALADMFEQRVDSYKETGSEEMSSHLLSLSDQGETLVRLADGSVVPFHLLSLRRSVPEILHTDAQRDHLLRLVERLRASAKLLRQVDEELAGAEQPSSAGTPSPADHLRAELSDPGYLLPPSEVGGRLYREGLRDRLARWLRDFLDSLEPAEEQTAPEVRQLSPVAVGLLLALLVVALSAVLLRRWRFEKPDSVGGAVPAVSEHPVLGLDARSHSPSSWREQALSLAAEGRHSEAVRSLFLATLARLDRNREIDYRPDHTNGEHLRSFGGEPERRRLFLVATQHFEGYWYGTTECGQREFEAMEQLCEPLVLGDGSGRLDGLGQSRATPGVHHGN